VLVVDDEEMVGDFMSEMLANWGLDVTVKRGPIEAEVWYAHDPSRVDLVITDQTMPRLTGVELARRLTGVRPDLPVILYTGYSDAADDEAMARSGICALLRKPVDAERLLALLRAHLPGTRQPPAAVSTVRPEPVPARNKGPVKRARRSTGKSTTRKRTANGRRAAR
jgi:DNA-binding NtrC family response regulator